MNSERQTQQMIDYRRIERAIDFIESRHQDQPSLEQIAAGVNLSKYHFQRLFKRWAGISPVQFLQYLTLKYAKRMLSESRPLLETSLDAGLSGPGRLHDLFVTFDAMTPGEFKRRGAGLEIRYGFHPTPFGECLAAVTDRGLCHLGFVDDSRAAALEQLESVWTGGDLVDDDKATAGFIRRVFRQPSKGSAQPFHLTLKGTNFQINVWRALLAIPAGKVVSYGDVAAYLGRPTASRAVGHAIASNPIAYLIPCHRVIASTGKIHRYRWGTARKKAILGWEAAASEIST